MFYDEDKIIKKIMLEKDILTEADKYKLIYDAIMFESENVLKTLLANDCFTYKIQDEPSVYELCIYRQNMTAFRILNFYYNLKEYTKDESFSLAVALNLPYMYIKEVFDSTADINVIGIRNGTALDWAVQNKNNEVLKLLADNHADFNIETESQNNLCLAAADGNYYAVKILIENGANVNGSRGEVPLILALHYDNYYIAEYLLKCGADIDAQDDDGRTSLHYCIIKYDVHKIEFLLKNGANIDKIDNYGISAKFLLENEDFRKKLFTELYE